MHICECENMYIHTYTYIHITEINEKLAMNFRARRVMWKHLKKEGKAGDLAQW